MSSFISNIKEHRLHKGLTQKELAELVDARRETIVRLEHAKYNPSLVLAAHVAHVLDVPLEELFDFSFD